MPNREKQEQQNNYNQNQNQSGQERRQGGSSSSQGQQPDRYPANPSTTPDKQREGRESEERMDKSRNR